MKLYESGIFLQIEAKRPAVAHLTFCASQTHVAEALLFHVSNHQQTVLTGIMTIKINLPHIYIFDSVVDLLIPRGVFGSLALLGNAQHRERECRLTLRGGLFTGTVAHVDTRKRVK